MRSAWQARSLRTLALSAVFSLGLALANSHTGHTTGKFEGVKANTGAATHVKINGKHILSVSEDFVIPDTPAPHWQVVDSKGNTYLLQQMKIKGDKFNRSIELPSYIRDVAKVQVWCSWAEALLGEASFPAPVK
jgi:hypothetical protein